MTTARCRLFAATLAAFALESAHAESRALDSASLWLGGYFTDADLAIRASTDGGDIDTGKVDLASGHETLGRARLDLVFGGSQGLTFDYYSLGRSTTH
ncbi:MAG TPA: hypothetical protein VFS15_20690, partial [Kofleriaceae bacterium]|nr:hypothetical protein [Kofleriaceae bacterium]